MCFFFSCSPGNSYLLLFLVDVKSFFGLSGVEWNDAACPRTECRDAGILLHTGWAFCAVCERLIAVASLVVGSRVWASVVVVHNAKSLQSCPTLCDPVDGSLPGSPVPGILQARTLEWVAISFSNA